MLYAKTRLSKQLDSLRHFIILPIILALCLVASVANAEPKFPELTGRVVDNANIIPDDIEAGLNQKLASIEAESSDQIVVVTLNSLDGYEIEEYGYRLGRQWAIGQKKLNNGILLLVAPNERKLRIEVGYGLEGAMPDIVAKNIIQTKIVPFFKAGDMPAGIVSGVNAIDETLKLTPEERADRAAKYAAANPKQGQSEGGGVPIIFIIFMIIWIISVIQSSRRNRFRSNFDASILPIIFHDWHNDGDGGGGGGFGGFGGGGGGFGGGGSSGDW